MRCVPIKIVQISTKLLDPVTVTVLLCVFCGTDGHCRHIKGHIKNVIERIHCTMQLLHDANFHVLSLMTRKMNAAAPVCEQHQSKGGLQNISLLTQGPILGS